MANTKGVSKKSFVFQHNNNNILNALEYVLRLRFHDATIVKQDKTIVAIEVGSTVWKEMDLVAKSVLSTFAFLDEDMTRVIAA